MRNGLGTYRNRRRCA